MSNFHEDCLERKKIKSLLPSEQFAHGINFVQTIHLNNFFVWMTFKHITSILKWNRIPAMRHLPLLRSFRFVIVHTNCWHLSAKRTYRWFAGWLRIGTHHVSCSCMIFSIRCCGCCRVPTVVVITRRIVLFRVGVPDARCSDGGGCCCCCCWSSFASCSCTTCPCHICVRGFVCMTSGSKWTDWLLDV